MEVIQMAHAGTMGLGQTTKAARGGNPWLVVAVMVAIVVATLAVWFATGSGLRTGATGRPAADNTYPMEALRGAATLSVDTSYNQIESLRIQAGRGPLQFDDYDLIEKQRIAPAVVGRFDAYDQAEKARGSGAVAVAAGKSSVIVGPGDYTFAQLQQMGAVKPSFDSFAGNPAAAIVPGSVVSGGSGVIVPGPYSYLQLQQMHITAITPAISATSGTFHVGNAQTADPIVPLNGIKTIDNPVKRDRVGGE
jgi:hypothetical protein